MGLDQLVYANGEEIFYFRKNYVLHDYVVNNCPYLPCSEQYETYHLITVNDMIDVLLLLSSKCESYYKINHLVKLVKYMIEHPDKTYILNHSW